MKRRWELLIWLHPKYWRFEINHAYGERFPPFLRELFWIGPFCLRLWADPRSKASVSRPIRFVL